MELRDMLQIVTGIAKNDDDFRFAIGYLAENSNSVASYLSDAKGLPFTPNPSASHFVPRCFAPFNEGLHKLACGFETIFFR